MSKQAVISVIQDVIGEYVQNMSKDSLNIALVRGKITLTDVQLDGDIIGSHVLGAVGLSGFVCLSCSARKLRITIPWGSLEKTPTKCEISGVHLVCVPLLPSNANSLSGAGTAADPRCTIRTRAKRSALARYERNFFGGRILGEGPMKNKNRRVELKRRTRAVRMSMEASLRSSAVEGGTGPHKSGNDGDGVGDGAAGDLKQKENVVGEEDDIDAGAAAAAAATADLRNALTMKLKAKAFRNIEAIIKQIHLRCEVSKGALHTNSSADGHHMKGSADSQVSAGERAFTFGCTLDSFVVRTATPSWETGESIFADAGDTSKSATNSGAKESTQAQAAGFGPGTGPTYKVVELNGIRIYWDNEPTFLITETDALTEQHTIPPHKVQKRIADAMEMMVDAQDPGDDIRNALALALATSKRSRDSVRSSRKRTASIDADVGDVEVASRQHEYCCSPFNLMFRATFSDIAQEGPSQWEVELLPFQLRLHIQPHQYRQYQQLRSVMIAQKKIDTMQHQRPDASPTDDPIAWWRYTVGRMVARPNARPWRDVRQIVKSRPRYIELVTKKLNKQRDGVGFHGGLNDEESQELLALEDALPIESLLSFHLLALRDVYRQQADSGEYLRREETMNSLLVSSETSSQKHRSSLKRITRKLTGKAPKRSASVADKSSTSSSGNDVEIRPDGVTELPATTASTTEVDNSCVLLSSPDDAIIQMKFIVRQIHLSVSLISPESKRPFVTLEVEADGSMYSSGMRVNIKEVALDLRRVSIDAHEGKILSIGSGEQEEAACRLMASRDVKSLALGVSARPATLVWNNACFHELLSFLSAKGAGDFQDMVKSKLRSAATPLAYKARVAFLSPKAISVEMNIEAPKVWLPISSSFTSNHNTYDNEGAIDGAIYFDAGLLRFSLSKGEGTADTMSVASISQINARYSESVVGFVVDDRGSIVPRLFSTLLGTKGDISIVRPFSINIDASVAADYEAWDGTISSLVDQIDTLSGNHVSTSIAVSIGDIYFDLVDAGTIIRAAGKLYAAEVLRAKQRVSQRREASTTRSSKPELEASAYQFMEDQGEHAEMRPVSNSLILTVTLDRIRAALASRVSSSERQYLFQLDSLKIQHATLFDKKLTRFVMIDASIHRRDRQLKLFGRPEAQSVATEGQKSTDCLDDNFIRASFLANRREGMNELELDIRPLVLVVTPLSLIDCKHSIKGIAEVGELIGREVERRVHHLGRSTRIRRAISSDASPRASPRTTNVKAAATNATFQNSVPNNIDSTLVFRLTMDDATILISSTIDDFRNEEAERGEQVIMSSEMLQVVSSALIMFQSVENDDDEATGSKTFHLSLDDFSASLVGANDSSQRVFDPSALEFRAVYSTQNHGSVVSQDFSLHGESGKAYASPSIIVALRLIGDSMSQIFASRGEKQAVAGTRPKHPPSRKRTGIGSLIQYQKSGTGIATSMKWELDSISCVVSRPSETQRSTCSDGAHLFEVLINDTKGSLDGCVSALYGDVNASFCINYFRPGSQQWDYIIEPFQLNLSVEQMPNEIVSTLALVSRYGVNSIFPRVAYVFRRRHSFIAILNNVQISTFLLFSTQIIDASTQDDQINANLTSAFLNDVAEVDFHPYQKALSLPEGDKVKGNGAFRFAASRSFSTEERNSRRGLSSHLVNESGCDILVCPMNAIDSEAPSLWEEQLEENNPNCVVVKAGSIIDLEGSCFAISLAKSTESLVGQRRPLLNLPIVDSTENSRYYRAFEPRIEDHPTTSSPHSDLQRLDEKSALSLYDVEPVVECCCENQRMRPSLSDVYSLDKGDDLLSSSTWSPGLECFAGRPTEITSQRSSLQGSIAGNWTRPFRQDDCPHFSDMTGTMKLARERVVLPDDNWIWANDWTIEINGSHGEMMATDADGWEYHTEFERFGRHRRCYQRGDSCRRRRWCRTRMIKPPRLEDPKRPIKVIWKSGRQKSGSLLTKICSPLSITNRVGESVVILLYSISWEQEEIVGVVPSGDTFHVPLPFASATYMRLARPRTQPTTSRGHRSDQPQLLDDYNCTERVLILPTVINASSLRRTTMIVDGDQRKKQHFNVIVQSTLDETRVVLEPILQVVNLLPCPLSCKVGQRERHDSLGIVGRTQTNIDVGGKNNSIAVDPRLKPHLSIALPGYDFSGWVPIVNRRQASLTWRPTDKDEGQILRSKKGENDVEDYKAVVELLPANRRTGDHLSIIMSVESGYCPVVRFWAQYWILDKTGFRLRFAEGFDDVLDDSSSFGSSTRRSHALLDKNSAQSLRSVPGYQWSVGTDGMSMYFSHKERLSIAIERDVSRSSSKGMSTQSQWCDPIDVANVMPKNIIQLEEYGGEGMFELSLSVALCPSIFGRTKLITIVPRTIVVNMLPYSLCIAQDGRLDRRALIDSQKSRPFHWATASLPSKVRLAPATATALDEREKDEWTNGSIELNKVGITSIRMNSPSFAGVDYNAVQVEVRLAAKTQSAAVMVLIYPADRSSSLYLLRNLSSRTILATQPLHMEEDPSQMTKNSQGFIDTSQLKSEESALRRVQRKGSVPSFRQGSRRKANDKSKSILSPFAGIDCGVLGACATTSDSFDEEDQIEAFIWSLAPRQDDVSFGFDDPERAHLLEWSCVDGNNFIFDDGTLEVGYISIDEMGSISALRFPDGREVKCTVKAEHSMKVIEFVDVRDSTVEGRNSRTNIALRQRSALHDEMIATQRNNTFDDGNTMDSNYNIDFGEEDYVILTLRTEIPGVGISLVENSSSQVAPASTTPAREIMFLHLDSITAEFGQTERGYHEVELQIMSVQIDNHIYKATHPVMLSSARGGGNEPFLHLSVVRKLQAHATTYVFPYLALRILPVDLRLDRRTTELLARFFRPIKRIREDHVSPHEYVRSIALSMTQNQSIGLDRFDFITSSEGSTEKLKPNEGRVYIEKMILHPILISLTFSQHWFEETESTPDGIFAIEFFRGLTSISAAPLTFTSFFVGHAFESPQALGQILFAHYNSQLFQQILSVLGSLEILTVPADLLGNVGTGVISFFYAPLQGLVQGPGQFIEGLETGTESLVRGVFVGVTRSAANLADAVNSNLVGLTADDEYIGERQKSLIEARSSNASKSLGASLSVAGASLARSFKSGAQGIVEQPSIYVSKHGAMGFAKGIAKAAVGAVVKPVVGIGDAAAVLLTHVSDVTGDQASSSSNLPKRLRRALPYHSRGSSGKVSTLIPFDSEAAKAQRIVTDNESRGDGDAYVGHVRTPSRLIIASESRLIVTSIDNLIGSSSRATVESDAWSWNNISHFDVAGDTSLCMSFFSPTGLKSYTIETGSPATLSRLYDMVSLQSKKMTNFSNPGSYSANGFISKSGATKLWNNYVLGSRNIRRTRIDQGAKDEIEMIERCCYRVRKLNRANDSFLQNLDVEAWTLVDSWSHFVSGLRARRCLAAGVFNGTQSSIQIKNTSLFEGGSPVYSLPSKDYDDDTGRLGPGGAIILFSWSWPPNLKNHGNIFLQIESSAFSAGLSQKSSVVSSATPRPKYKVQFLEKSLDPGGWWAKFWLLCLDDDDDGK